MVWICCLDSIQRRCCLTVEANPMTRRRNSTTRIPLKEENRTRIEENFIGTLHIRIQSALLFFLIFFLSKKI